MVHYRIRAEESPAAVAGAVAKESSGRAARDDSFGGGKRALPEDIRVLLALLAERRFRNGVIHLHDRVSG